MLNRYSFDEGSSQRAPRYQQLTMQMLLRQVSYLRMYAALFLQQHKFTVRRNRNFKVSLKICNVLEWNKQTYKLRRYYFDNGINFKLTFYGFMLLLNTHLRGRDFSNRWQLGLLNRLGGFPEESGRCPQPLHLTDVTGGSGFLQMRWVAVNAFKKQSEPVDKGWFDILGSVRGPSVLHSKKLSIGYSVMPQKTSDLNT
jgi:hypothetical protein